MKEFYTIDKNETAEIIEKNSRFIAQLFYVENIEEAERYIKETKKKYMDAKHNCFAYAIKEKNSDGLLIKYNDDGEPSGTAGAPMLKIILEKGLTNILVITTRYFGGTLLGTGGLVRAYTNAALKALEKAQIVKKFQGYKIKIKINYSDLKKAKHYFKNTNSKILNIKYLHDVEIEIESNKDIIEEITNNNSKKGFEIIKYDILEEKYV